VLNRPPPTVAPRKPLAVLDTPPPTVLNLPLTVLTAPPPIVPQAAVTVFGSGTGPLNAPPPPAMVAPTTPLMEVRKKGAQS